MNSKNIFETELNQPSVFKDETKLSIRYIPQTLQYRTEELKFLPRYFKGLFEGKFDGKNLILHGSVGTGKTSIAKKFAIWASERENLRKIEYVHINCRLNRSIFTILLSIARELNNHIPSRGYSSHELLEMVIDMLETKNHSLILILDEIDFILEGEISDLIYSICRSSDNRRSTKHFISLILISRTLNFLKLLDNATMSTLGAGTLELQPYTEEQLLDIFTNRVEEVFKKGTIPEDTLLLTSDIAGKTGDARKGLELLWYAGKFADQQNSPLVYPDYIRIAKGNIQPSYLRDTLEGLSRQKLLIYHAISRCLKVNKTAYITTGELKEYYQMSCEEFGDLPRKHTQLWDYLQELSQIGLIETKASESGQRGTTTLITLEDISADQLEKVVREFLTE